MTKHTTIKQRLMLLIVAPLISLLVFGGTLIATSYTAYRTAERTQSVLVLAVAAGKLGHALQIERGSTAGFLQSKGARFADVLPDVRARTDEQLAVFAHEAAQPALASLAALNAQLEPLRPSSPVLPRCGDAPTNTRSAFPNRSRPIPRRSPTCSS